MNKAVITLKNSARCLVIDFGCLNSPKYRLPLLSEVAKSVLERYSVKELSESLSIIETDKEYSVWDLFDPFPPNNYGDYGYLGFEDKQSAYWQQLIEVDRKLLADNGFVVI